MKKLKKTLVLFFTVILTLSSVSAINVFAQSSQTEELKYEDNFNSYFSDRYSGEILSYDELYYHYTDNAEVDWVLVSASSNSVQPMNSYAVIGGRVYTKNNIYNPFSLGYGIYDVSSNQFFDVCELEKNGNYTNYDEFYEVLNSIESGKLIGDADKDGKLTVKDATYIQKCLVNLIPFDKDDIVTGMQLTSKLEFYSDFDIDGSLDISDATAIQKHITLAV